MKTVVLKALELEGFRSFTANTVIEFSQTEGLKLICGQNDAEPSLGANGVGKSSIWDAVCFCLYGTSVKGKLITELVSWEHKDGFVEGAFLIDDREVKVKRQGPPQRLFLDGKLVEQFEIDQLFGLSKPRFLNSVIFGQAVPLFIDLDIPKRGELIDEVMDSGFWLDASEQAGKHVTEQAKLIVGIDNAIARLEGQLSAFSDDFALIEQESLWDDDREQRLTRVIDAVDLIEKEIAAFEKDHKRVSKAIDGLTVDKLYVHVERNRDLLNRANTDLEIKEAEIERIEKSASFYVDNSTCPRCGQEISEGFAEEHLDEAAGQIETLEKACTDLLADSKKHKEALTTCEAEWRTEFDKQSRLNQEFSVLNANISNKTRDLNRLVAEAESINDEKNPYAEQRAANAKKKEEVESLLLIERNRKDTETGRMAQFEYWKTAFKKVRLFAIKRIMQQLTIETRNSAAALGLLGWKITFTTETETKSGTMKSGVQIELETPLREGKFDSFSPGEAQRVRLAVTLGLASLIQRYAGVRWTWEVFDEPSAWLSEKGIEDLLSCLHRRAELLQKSLYVVDHRALVYSGFSEIIQVTKTLEGARIDLLSRAET